MIQTTTTPPTRPLENILDLNNHAVSYLCQGNHSATTSTLRTAIKSLERCFQEDSVAAAAAAAAINNKPCCCSCPEPAAKKRRRSTGAAVTSASAVPSTPSTVKQQGAFVAIRSITVSDSSSSSSTATDLPAPNNSSLNINDDTSLLMVYDRAFDFPSIVNDDDDTTDEFGSHQSKTRLAAILLYNLGLSYHREGARSGKSGDLQMALKCYREAYMVLKSAWAKSDFKEVFVLLVALLNNMACIHCHMSDCKDTHQCINWMNRAIASRRRSILSKEDYTFFSLNLSVFRGHQLRLASAA